MKCCPFGRIIVTGSGLAALLDAVRKSPPNGFPLWDAGVRLPLGREPSPAAALGMAERIVAAFSTKWPEHACAVITAPLLVTSLASLGDAPLYSPRPALVAYVTGCIGDAQNGAPGELLAEAMLATAVKLVLESSHDVARLLLTMDLGSRVTLRKLADDLGWAKQLPGKIQDVLEALFPKEANTGRLFASLCEADWPLRLMPPYGNLVHSWIETDGRISFAVEGDHLVLLPRAQAVLTFISDRAASIPPSAQNAASAAVLDVLVHHGLGIRAAGGALRAPCTADEMRAIPAIMAVAAALDLAEQEKSKRRSPHVLMLDSCSQANLGWWLIKALRHLGAHVYFGTPYILRNGLTAATATAVTRAAADAIVATSGGKIVEMPDGSLDFLGRMPC